MTEREYPRYEYQVTPLWVKKFGKKIQYCKEICETIEDNEPVGTVRLSKLMKRSIGSIQVTTLWLSTLGAIEKTPLGCVLNEDWESILNSVINKIIEHLESMKNSTKY